MTSPSDRWFISFLLGEGMFGLTRGGIVGGAPRKPFPRRFRSREELRPWERNGRGGGGGGGSFFGAGRLIGPSSIEEFEGCGGGGIAPRVGIPIFFGCGRCIGRMSLWLFSKGFFGLSTASVSSFCVTLAMSGVKRSGTGCKILGSFSTDAFWKSKLTGFGPGEDMLDVGLSTNLVHSLAVSLV